MAGEVFREQTPVGGVERIGAQGDGWAEHLRRMPPAAGDEEHFAGLKDERRAASLREEWILREIGILDVADGGEVALGILLRIHESRVVGGPHPVLFQSVELHEKGVRGHAVPVEYREGSTGAADVDFHFGSAVHASPEGTVKEPSLGPVGHRMRRHGCDVGDEVGEVVGDDVVRPVGRRVGSRGREDQGDEVAHLHLETAVFELEELVGIGAGEEVGGPLSGGGPVGQGVGENDGFILRGVFGSELGGGEPGAALDGNTASQRRGDGSGGEGGGMHNRDFP